MKIAGAFPKIVYILALRVTPIFIGFTNVFFTVNRQPLCQFYVVKLGRWCFRNMKFVGPKLAIIHDEKKIKKIGLNYTRLRKVQ